MANRKIDLNDLAQAIEQELTDYSEEVTEGLKKEVRAVAKDAVAKLKATSPRDTGEYARGWKSRVEYESAEDIRVRIYNGKKPQLTHLLENGYAKVNGGRKEGIPHIGPVEQEVQDDLESKVKVVVRG